jgi:tRNA-specific 2-thiouridylase
VCTPEQLAHALFPLGDTTKADIRLEAERRGLRVADKPDSHDICFIADGDTRGFLAERLGSARGPIVDTDGNEVGEHDGAYAYTIGQRKGLRLGTPAPDGRPRYVLDISPVTNTVTVGPREALDVREITGERPVWLSEPRAGAFECRVQLRAHGEVHAATAERDADVLRVRLAEPARGVAPGQAAVLYEGDRVLASATIAEAARVPA